MWTPAAACKALGHAFTRTTFCLHCNGALLHASLLHKLLSSKHFRLTVLFVFWRLNCIWPPRSRMFLMTLCPICVNRFLASPSVAHTNDFAWSIWMSTNDANLAMVSMDSWRFSTCSAMSSQLSTYDHKCIEGHANVKYLWRTKLHNNIAPTESGQPSANPVVLISPGP